MSSKLVVAVLGAMVAVGTVAEASATNNTTVGQPHHKKLPEGFEKCKGIARAGRNDCASNSDMCGGNAREDGSKNAWLGLPKGTCSKIVNGSLAEVG